ncbi:DNA-binding FrmR family transcriptional regulator [Deinobacterium chartae]|uniref:Copper-sensing transcriptional repressor CsoR n=1 Tax=Deinobacterium chartae TaxID=521158 RepID=A0A841I7D1_9DEIO|nr:DNA-binding FrmR family transcriptional regulator [Deinobacterium chartae]
MTDPAPEPHTPQGESCHAHTETHLCMPEDARVKAARRLAIARGHLESVRRSLENPDVYCVDVLKQLKAVQGAIEGAAAVVLRGHLEAHVATAHERGDEQKIVDELMEVFKYT